MVMVWLWYGYGMARGRGGLKASVGFLSSIIRTNIIPRPAVLPHDQESKQHSYKRAMFYSPPHVSSSITGSL